MSDGKLGEQDVMVACFDINDEQEMRRQFERILQQFGRVDVLLNNAGILRIRPAVEMSLALEQRVVNTNFLANIQLSKMVIRHWTQCAQAGQIIVTSSISGYVSFPFFAIYGASKAALQVRPPCI